MCPIMCPWFSVEPFTLGHMSLYMCHNMCPSVKALQLFVITPSRPLVGSED